MTWRIDQVLFEVSAEREMLIRSKFSVIGESLQAAIASSQELVAPHLMDGRHTLVSAVSRWDEDLESYVTVDALLEPQTTPLSRPRPAPGPN